MKRRKMWIQRTGIKRHPGKLHKQLGMPAGKKIPTKLLTEIAKANIGTKVRGHTVTGLLKRRAVLARTLRRY
jgi:hypothetical protein